MSEKDLIDLSIRELTAEDFDLFWPVRLLALEESPKSFWLASGPGWLASLDVLKPKLLSPFQT